MALRSQPVRNADTGMAAGLPNLSGPGSIYCMHSVSEFSFDSSSFNAGAYKKKDLNVKVTKEDRVEIVSIFHNIMK